MTTILYWNIENFSINKINNPSRKKKYGRLTEEEASTQRQNYILRHIDDLDPDIVVFVEIETPWNNNRGTLCRGGGEEGLEYLLELLCESNPAWGLVPPLVTGNKETVAVFFRQDKLQFSGPKLWGGGNGPAAPGIVANTATAYTKWTTMYNTAVNANSAFNANVPQTKCAAAVDFVDSSNVPVPVNFGDGIRTPYQTTFWDTAGLRNINIFAVHAPASYVGANQFIANMTRMDEIVKPLRPNEVRIIIGDFNCNLLRKADDTYINPYAPLRNLGYTVALAPPTVVPNPTLGYRGYFATHIRPTDNAQFWSDVNNTSYYPNFFYTGDSTNPGTNESIDNALYWSNVPNLPIPELTIINGIVGSPYRTSNPPRPSGGTPAGPAIFGREIDWTPLAGAAAAPDTGPILTNNPGAVTKFRSFACYGKIRSTSDHLPLFFSI